MEEIHQENNVVVEILILSHYKVTWQIILHYFLDVFLPFKA